MPREVIHVTGGRLAGRGHAGRSANAPTPEEVTSAAAVMGSQETATLVWVGVIVLSEDCLGTQIWWACARELCHACLVWQFLLGC